MMEAIDSGAGSSKIPNIQVCKFAKENLDEQQNILKSKQNDQHRNLNENDQLRNLNENDQLTNLNENDEADIIHTAQKLRTKRRFSERDKLFCDEQVVEKDTGQIDLERVLNPTPEKDVDSKSSSSIGGIGQEEPILKRNDSCFNQRSFDSFQTPISHTSANPALLPYQNPPTPITYTGLTSDSLELEPSPQSTPLELGPLGPLAVALGPFPKSPPSIPVPQEPKRRSTVIQTVIQRKSEAIESAEEAAKREVIEAAKKVAIEAAQRAAKNEAIQAAEKAAKIKQSFQFWVGKFSDILIEHLNKFGLCVIDDFIGEAKGNMILKEVLHMQETIPFMDGKLSKDLSNLSVRSDKISWVDAINPPCPAIRSLLNLLDAIVLTANKSPGNGALQNYKIQGRTKAMVACYPGRGSHYVRHVDNPNRDGRCITAIYYLNKNWVKEHGGKLMIYPSKPVGAVASVDPIFDRVLFFWSDRRNPHEVLPAYRPRYAITAWYFDSEEKTEYTKRQEASKLI